MAKLSWGRLLAFVGLVAMAIVARMIPHPPNFSPLLAVALFAGAKAPRRWLAYIVPLAALWMSDLLIETHYLMWLVGACMLVTTAIGGFTESAISDKSKWSKIFGWGIAGLVSAVFFFLATNFAVWQTTSFYPHTTDGLWSSYIMGLPFFQNDVLSTWLFSGVLFGVYHLTIESRIMSTVNNRQ